MMPKAKLRIAISSGDPAGIGPEIIKKALADPKLRRLATYKIFAAPYSGPLGKPSAASGSAALSNVLDAARSVLRGEADALVTAPLSKEAIHLAGSRMPGH